MSRSSYKTLEDMIVRAREMERKRKLDAASSVEGSSKKPKVDS